MKARPPKASTATKAKKVRPKPKTNMWLELAKYGDAIPDEVLDKIPTDLAARSDDYLEGRVE